LTFGEIVKILKIVKVFKIVKLFENCSHLQASNFSLGPMVLLDAIFNLDLCSTFFYFRSRLAEMRLPLEPDKLACSIVSALW